MTSDIAPTIRACVRCFTHYYTTDEDSELCEECDDIVDSEVTFLE